ncbi:MAG TPA: ATP-binding cassette domain-containing protein [bacterium]|nr:ATP-binding cassette domain-containing protein [bacterium]
MSLEIALQARQLTKRYDAFLAVDAIDFTVQVGECVGFLGPNGAGKTSTVRMVGCLSPLTSGTVQVFGFDVTKHPRKIKEMLGVCPQEDNLDPDFTTAHNLLVFARYFDLPRDEAQRRTDELLDLMQLRDKSAARVEELSGGMKRRLALARALLNRPRLLLLDEPTTGLDPQARHLMWQRIRQLKADGVTCLLTTHYMEEAQRLCDRVILMDGGKILLEGRPQELIEREVGREVCELWNTTRDVKQFVRSQGWIFEEVEDRLYVYDREGGMVRKEIETRFPAQERLLRHASLEDVFLLRAGRMLRE